MAYQGTNTTDVTALVASSTAVYALSAGATETAYTFNLGELNLAVGDALSIEVRGDCAANVNAKTIAVELVNGGTAVWRNNTTTAPNGLDWVIQILVVVESTSNKATGQALVMFDAVAPEVQKGQVTVTLGSGSVTANVKFTGVALNDLTGRGVQVWVHRQIT